MNQCCVKIQFDETRNIANDFHPRPKMDIHSPCWRDSSRDPAVSIPSRGEGNERLGRGVASITQSREREMPASSFSSRFSSVSRGKVSPFLGGCFSLEISGRRDLTARKQPGLRGANSRQIYLWEGWELSWFDLMRIFSYFYGMDTLFQSLEIITFLLDKENFFMYTVEYLQLSVFYIFDNELGYSFKNSTKVKFSFKNFV